MNTVNFHNHFFPCKYNENWIIESLIYIKNRSTGKCMALFVSRFLFFSFVFLHEWNIHSNVLPWLKKHKNTFLDQEKKRYFKKCMKYYCIYENMHEIRCLASGDSNEDLCVLHHFMWQNVIQHSWQKFFHVSTELHI